MKTGSSDVIESIRVGALPAHLQVKVPIPTEFQVGSMGKRHARILAALDEVRGRTIHTARENVCNKTGKFYSTSDFAAAVQELRLMGAYVREDGDMLYLTARGSQLLGEVKTARPEMLEASTSPNINTVRRQPQLSATA